ncbi:MAG: AsnC family transcriptional regulator [Thermoanaerobacteraceae bacterium]|uniref:siroheme decarboxylase subunit alpha n=1 Tax=Thermanaeromonas sp. C210 TaxID=2731925 RepID=UPI00155CF9D8|nr:AsnC family transcriptional regulator [Thermanaeromonas sp. C210]MBE3580978.1 AsnC family transcriptional regulator [Thermoanaerobacteraceae bacterium]GFN23580.1 AsnC family transcriptional regulator [Thermanaeromonas sp. C210]
MDNLDRQLLNLIQQDFPLTGRPYLEIGRRLNLSEGEVIKRLKKLKKAGIVRRIGAVFDLRRLGYVSTLCALKVPPERLVEVAEVVNSFPGVTHNYLREHEYSMWFTLIGPSRQDLERTMEEIKRRTGLTELLELPAERSFKIRVNFNLEVGADNGRAVL